MEYSFWSFLWGALHGKLSHPSGVYQVQFPEEVLSGASALFHLDWLPSRPGVYCQPVLLLTILRGPSAPLLYWTPFLGLLRCLGGAYPYLAPSEMVHGRLIFRELTCLKMSHIWLIIWLRTEIYVGDGFPSDFWRQCSIITFSGGFFLHLLEAFLNRSFPRSVSCKKRSYHVQLSAN